jgi:hypothetical protein
MESAAQPSRPKRMMMLRPRARVRYKRDMGPTESKSAIKPSLMNGPLRTYGLVIMIAAAVPAVIGLLANAAVSETNMLVASAALAFLGAIFIAVSLIAHLLETRDHASLVALAEDTHRNLALAQRVAEQVDREFPSDPAAGEDVPGR